VESKRPLYAPVHYCQHQPARVHDDLKQVVTPTHRICAVVLDEANKPAGLRQLAPSVTLRVAGIGDSAKTVMVCHNDELFYVFREDVIPA
jgi:hypothetical protein